MGFHILGLPPEILCQVVSHLVADGTWALGHALFVCRQWHSTITSDQKSWSTIDIGEAYVQYFRLRPKTHALSYLRAALVYSGTSPIQIAIDWRYNLPCYRGHNSDIPSSCRMPLGEAVAILLLEDGRHLRRCRTLSVIYGSAPDSDFLTKYAPHLINLQSVSISGFNGNSASTLAHIFLSPRLRVVTVLQSDWESFKGALGKGSLATQLTIERSQPWKPRHVEFLAAFSALHTLTITRNVREDVWSHGNEMALPRVLLRDLSTLRLKGPVHRLLLNSLNVPSLISLYIADDDWARNALGYVHITAWSGRIRHLHLDLVEDGWASDVLRIVEKTELKTITLTQSMSEDGGVDCIPGSIVTLIRGVVLPSR